MLDHSNVSNEVKKIGFNKVKIYLEPCLLRLIENWPVTNDVHPSYDEMFRLREVIIELKNAMKAKQSKFSVLFLSEKLNFWSRVELKIFKVDKSSCLVRLAKFH